jgi:hypothetical protein
VGSSHRNSEEATVEASVILERWLIASQNVFVSRHAVGREGVFLVLDGALALRPVSPWARCNLKTDCGDALDPGDSRLLGAWGQRKQKFWERVSLEGL